VSTFLMEISEPTERIEAEVCTLAGQIAAATCRFVLLIAELDRRESWREWGCRSMAHWLSWKCALGIVASRDHVRVGRALDDLPKIRAAFAEGRLSYSKVRALTRVAEHENEADLLEFATVATASQLERTVRGFEKVRGDVDAERGRLDRRRLRFFDEPDGAIEVSGRIGRELYDLLKLALDRAFDDVARVEDDSAEARRVDALEVIVRAFLAGRADRPPTEVVVHVEADELDEDEISPHVEELLCDASVRVDVLRPRSVNALTSTMLSRCSSNHCDQITTERQRSARNSSSAALYASGRSK
jgi:hypothetical protein